MKRALGLFAVGLVTMLGALAFVFLRGEDTRERVRVVERRVTVDPCKRPKSDACQRRIRLVLRELARRYPDALRRLGLEPRKFPKSADSGNFAGGGGSDNPPSGGGPTGRVPPRVSPPQSDPTEPPGAAEPNPLLDVETPDVPSVCVGDLLRVNCD